MRDLIYWERQAEATCVLYMLKTKYMKPEYRVVEKPEGLKGELIRTVLHEDFKKEHPEVDEAVIVEPNEMGIYDTGLKSPDGAIIYVQRHCWVAVTTDGRVTIDQDDSPHNPTIPLAALVELQQAVSDWLEVTGNVTLPEPKINWPVME